MITSRSSTCIEALRQAYERVVARRGERSEFIEGFISCARGGIGVDPGSGGRASFAELFSLECRSLLEQIYNEALERMRRQSFGASAQTLVGLDHLQELIAVALWRHGLEVGELLDTFAREYDRLDVEEVRLRLYRLAQEGLPPPEEGQG